MRTSNVVGEKQQNINFTIRLARNFYIAQDQIKFAKLWVNKKISAF